MLVGLRLWPSGRPMTRLADMARSAKKRLESRPETSEICEVRVHVRVGVREEEVGEQAGD